MLSEKTYTTIKNPVITEKAAIQKSASNTYVFKVSKEATKTDIKNSIEEVFGVTVNSVRVLNTKFKNKRTNHKQGDLRERTDRPIVGDFP